jgi:formylglycine-generating enzyme required for sulfatase activity
MNLITQLTCKAFVFVSVLVTTSAYASAPVTETRPQPETLPDGNVRDPQPTADELSNFLATVKKNMVFLPGGTFEMGDWGSEVNENGLPFDGTHDSKPLHKVTLSGFHIGKYPVTYAEFDVFTAARRLPRVNQENSAKRYRKPDNPAGVTWQGAKDYCKWLAQLAGQRFDLPTEAQWEYAARSGGMRHIYPTDNGEAEPGRNLPSYAQRQAAGGLVAVSSFPPNRAGIYYMSAGVREFTNDWYDPHYYGKSPSLDPTGPTDGTYRVVRGFFGNVESAMTFKRWNNRHAELTGTWKLYAAWKGGEDREIPYTKYSNYSDVAFRCALNLR